MYARNVFVYVLNILHMYVSSPLILPSLLGVLSCAHNVLLLYLSFHILLMDVDKAVSSAHGDTYTHLFSLAKIKLPYNQRQMLAKQNPLGTVGRDTWQGSDYPVFAFAAYYTQYKSLTQAILQVDLEQNLQSVLAFHSFRTSVVSKHSCIVLVHRLCVEELVAHVIASVSVSFTFYFYYGGRLNGQSFSFSFQLFRVFFFIC